MLPLDIFASGFEISGSNVSYRVKFLVAPCCLLTKGRPIGMAHGWGKVEQWLYGPDSPPQHPQRQIAC